MCVYVCVMGGRGAGAGQWGDLKHSAKIGQTIVPGVHWSHILEQTCNKSFKEHQALKG